MVFLEVPAQLITQVAFITAVLLILYGVLGLYNNVGLVILESVADRVASRIIREVVSSVSESVMYDGDAVVIVRVGVGVFIEVEGGVLVVKVSLPYQTFFGGGFISKSYTLPREVGGWSIVYRESALSGDVLVIHARVVSADSIEVEFR